MRREGKKGNKEREGRGHTRRMPRLEHAEAAPAAVENVLARRAPADLEARVREALEGRRAGEVARIQDRFGGHF